MGDTGNQANKSDHKVQIVAAIITLAAAVIGFFGVILPLLAGDGKTDPPRSSPSSSVVTVTPPSTSLTPVTELTHPPPGSPSLGVSKGIVQPGEMVVISGRGYPANIRLEFTWNVHVPDEAFSVGKRSLGIGDVDERGTFAVPVTLPSDVCNGTGTIDAFNRSTPIPVLQTNLEVQGANC